MKLENLAFVSKRFQRMTIGILALLSIPLLAMLFTSEVNWGLFDFLVMGILLLSIAVISELILRNVKTRLSRILLCGISICIGILIWMDLAVGLFDSPIAGN